MNHQLTILCRKKSDAMERVLRTVRHRGFTLEGMTMTLSGCGREFELSIEVRSQRSLHLLTSQLQKLHDVLRLNDSGQVSRQ